MPHCPPRFLLMSPLDNTQSSVITPRLPEPLHFSAFQRKMSFLFAAHTIPHWAPRWVQWCCPRNKTKWQAQHAQNHSSLPQADAVLQGFLAYISCSFLKASLSQETQPPMVWTVDWTLVSPLNPCVESLPPQCDGVRTWGLWEVIRSWGWSPCE